jgi:hypothetical protein
MSGSSSRNTAGNPLAVNLQREQRVRERAYHLWEAENKPHGRDVEFWERARELIAIEDSAGAGQLPNPKARPESARESKTEEAEIQENLGKFPDSLADQGEVQPTPKPKRKTGARTKKSKK